MNNKGSATWWDILWVFQAKELEASKYTGRMSLRYTKPLERMMLFLKILIIQVINQNGGELSRGQNDIRHWKHVTKTGLYSDDIKSHWHNVINTSTRFGFHE